MEKGSELPKGDPGRKYKGRVVFLGDRVRDQQGRIAVFEEMSSSPAALEAGKLCDFYGCLLAGGGAGDISGVTEPFVLMQSDATQAYCQADLGGKATWIRLPPERWPEGWKGMKDPVCKLVKALYGHPNSGSYWEEKCDRKIKNGRC